MKVTIFHPDFPSSHPLGGAIIQCQDGISFRFPLELLHVAEPFAHASELAPPVSETNKDEVITLTNVPAQGFHILLLALHPLTPYHTESDKINALAQKSVEDLVEGFEVAKILDIPTFARLLIPFFPDPFVKFALSTGSDDDALKQEMAEMTFGHRFNQIPLFAEYLMMELDNTYFTRLQKLHQTRNAIPRSLLPALMQKDRKDEEGFTRKCIKLNCPAMMSVKGRCWQGLRNRAVAQVWEHMLHIRPPPEERCAMSDHILEEVCRGCPRCKERLSVSFSRAIKNTVAQSVL